MMARRGWWIAAALLCSALLSCCVARADESASVEDTAPIGTRQNYFLPQFSNGSFRHMDLVFPYHIVHRAGTISELPRADRQLSEVTYKWKGAAHSLDELLKATKTTGFLVIKDGKIVEERYFNGASEESLFTSMSVAKSFTSTLVGLALADGKIKSIDDPVTAYVPELKATGYDGVPIKALLQMSSGVKFSESYLPGPPSDMDVMFQRTMIDEAVPLDDYLTTIKADLRPGTKFAYKSPDTQALGWLLRKVTGKSLAGYLSEKIWQPMGMEHDAIWNVDAPGPNGVEAAFTGLNATLRDYGRFGQMFLDHGKWNGCQIVPTEWIALATAPQSAQVRNGALIKGYPLGYGYQWWTFPWDGAYAAEGIYFQFIFVDPKENLIIVKTSAFDHPWDASFEGQTYAAFWAIAAALAQHQAGPH